MLTFSFSNGIEICVAQSWVENLGFVCSAGGINYMYYQFGLILFCSEHQNNPILHYFVL